MYGAQLSDTTGPLAGVPYQGTNPAYASLYNKPASAKDKPPVEWLQKWEKRHLELVDKYQPDFIFLDGGIPHGQYGLNVISHYLNKNASAHQGRVDGVVTTGSLLPYLERGMSPVLREKPWLTVSSVSGWFYMNHNPKFDSHSNIKDSPTVIHTLIDVVSKNGNLLLNFPQRGDGSLYPECEAVLDELAKWMPINGEAIFGTRPWTTYGEGPSQFEPKGMNELMQPLSWKDIRFTTKGNILYAFCLGLPQGEVKITSLAAQADKIKSIELLGSKEKINWKATPEAVVIQPVKEWPCQHAVTFKIQLGQ
jgi:alpha-L-fucosidase